MPQQTQNLSLSNELRQEQILAPQQIQSLEILMLPTLELEERIAQEMETNPMLEIGSPSEEAPPASETEHEDAELGEAHDELPIAPPSDENGLSSPYDLKEEELRRSKEDPDEELSRILQLADSWQSPISAPGPGSGFSEADDERRQRLFDNIVEEPSLQETLLDQLRLADKSPELEKAAELLIGSIDDSGYLRTTLADLATTAQVELPVIEKALALVQTFDPPGIGARDLKECLLLQLERQGRGKGRLAKLVRSHLDEIARNKLPQVAKEMGLGLDELNELLEELRSLNPHPGAAVAPDSPVYVAPELSVERVGNDFKIVQNDDAFPRLRISKLYLRLLEDPNTPEETRAYIKNKLNGGKMLIKSLEQRQSTIRRIAEVIVSEQYDFFDKGIEFLKPLTMQQVADKLGLHETTISRAIANKYMSAPSGLFEFKYFFTGGYQSSGGEEVSSRGVKEMIRDIIAREEPDAPISDSKIAETLKARGLDVARRTVAKYREELGIQSSHLRKAY